MRYLEKVLQIVQEPQTKVGTERVLYVNTSKNRRYGSLVLLRIVTVFENLLIKL